MATVWMDHYGALFGKTYYDRSVRMDIGKFERDGIMLIS